MLRFCDKEVCCISYEELDRGTLSRYFFQGNMDEMICVFNIDGTYRGRITYYSLIKCDKAEDAVLEDHVILNNDFWKHARDFFANHELKHERGFGEHVLLPVVNEEKQLISFVYEDDDANRELRMLKELGEISGALSFADIYPQYESVKICGFNELAIRFAEYLSKQNICVETDGELWERFFPDGDKTEVPDYKRLIIYAEGVQGGRTENWVENLLRSVSPEFECVDCIYEANWKEGIVKDTETDIAGLLDYLGRSDKEIAILGTDMEAQNAYDFLVANGIEAQCFVSDIFEERQHLLFGKRVFKGAEISNRSGEMILLECQGVNSALGVPILERYDYMGFRRNRNLFLLKDYVEIPYHDLKHTLHGQSILFVGDIFLCNRIAGYLKKNVEVREMFYADVLNSDAEGIYDNGILRQTELVSIDKDILCLIVLPQFAGSHETKIIADNDKKKRDITCILREKGLLNYTDYFSYIRSFVELEKGMEEKGYKKEQFRPKKIILGAIGYNSGNLLVRGLLDNHPSILMMPNMSLLDNNLLWICAQLSGVPSRKILPLFKSMYSWKDIGLCSTKIFEEKLEELLGAGESFTSQELFVIFMIAYVAMHGREIEDVRNMMIYWEPHNMSAVMRETFVDWLGTEEGLCDVLNVVRNICMVNGSMVKWALKEEGLENALIHSMSYPDISEKNQGKFERYVVRFEDLKLHPREKLSELCKYWEIPWSETLMEATEYGKRAVYDDGFQKIYDFDLKPVYNTYEEYFSSFDRFRFTLICAPWQKKYGYPYVEICGFSRRELQEMFLKEFRIEKAATHNSPKWKLDAKIRMQERIRKWLWNIRKQELLEKYKL